MRLIDSHGHLQAAAFAADRDEVAAAARLAAVEWILAPGTSSLIGQAPP